MELSIELDVEEDGRWIADVKELPGVLVYGDSAVDATRKAASMAFRVLAEKVKHNELELIPDVFFYIDAPEELYVDDALDLLESEAVVDERLAERADEVRETLFYRTWTANSDKFRKWARRLMWIAPFLWIAAYFVGRWFGTVTR